MFPPLEPASHPIASLEVVIGPPFEFPESYSKFPLAIYFSYDSVHVSMLLSLFISPFPSSLHTRVHKFVLYVWVSIAALWLICIHACSSSVTSCIPELAEHLSMYFALSCLCTSAHAVPSAWNAPHNSPFLLTFQVSTLMASLPWRPPCFLKSVLGTCPCWSERT